MELRPSTDSPSTSGAANGMLYRTFATGEIEAGEVLVHSSVSYCPTLPPSALPELLLQQCCVVCGTAECDALSHATRPLLPIVSSTGCMTVDYLTPTDTGVLVQGLGSG